MKPYSRIGGGMANVEVSSGTGSRNPRVPKASDVLANIIKVRVLSEGLKAGERLPSEAELIEQYNFSRGTVREALRMLESDGIVRIRRGPRGGIEVASPDVHHVTRSLAVLLAFDGTPVSDLVKFRLIVEPAAAASAAQNATQKQRDDLVAAAARPNGDTVPHSVAFHRLMGQATNNAFMSTILTAVYQVLEWQTDTQTLSDTEQSETVNAHVSIAAAILAGDGAKADHVMRVHLEEFRGVLERQGRLHQPIVPRRNATTSNKSAAWY